MGAGRSWARCWSRRWAAWARMAFGPRVGLLAARHRGGVSGARLVLRALLVRDVFLVLLWWAFERLIAADARGAAGAAAAGGLLWGLAILSRETILYFLPLARPGWPGALAAARGRAARGALFVLSAVLTVAPWTYRNWVAFRAFVPVSTAGGLNLFQGNARLTRQEVYDLYEAVHGRIEQYRFARARGAGRPSATASPAWPPEKLATRCRSSGKRTAWRSSTSSAGAYGPVAPRRRWRRRWSCLRRTWRCSRLRAGAGLRCALGAPLPAAPRLPGVYNLSTW